MVKSGRSGESPIQGLLDERHKLETWLLRLAERGDAPQHVLARIRQDYEQRLQQLIQELKRHMQALRDGLSEREDTRRRLSADAQDLEDRLAEARLRHDVGEYADEEWDRIAADGEAELAAVRARLATVHDEITRLSEVVRLIEASDRRPASVPASPQVAPASPPAAPPPTAGARTVHSRPSAPPEVAKSPSPNAAPPPRPSGTIMPDLVPPPVESPAPADDESPVVDAVADQHVAVPDRPGQNTTGGQTEAFPADEMDFLKRLNEDEAPVPPKRPSDTRRGPTLVREPDVSVPRPSSPFRRPSAGQAEKTLRCADCGTMNLPTEWYCEHCGAELAAL